MFASVCVCVVPAGWSGPSAAAVNSARASRGRAHEHHQHPHSSPLHMARRARSGRRPLAIGQQHAPKVRPPAPPPLGNRRPVAAARARERRRLAAAAGRPAGATQRAHVVGRAAGASKWPRNSLGRAKLARESRGRQMIFGARQN
jgi:hypothetical protein